MIKQEKELTDIILKNIKDIISKRKSDVEVANFIKGRNHSVVITMKLYDNTHLEIPNAWHASILFDVECRDIVTENRYVEDNAEIDKIIDFLYNNLEPFDSGPIIKNDHVLIYKSDGFLLCALTHEENKRIKDMINAI